MTTCRTLSRSLAVLATTALLALAGWSLAGELEECKQECNQDHQECLQLCKQRLKTPMGLSKCKQGCKMIINDCLKDCREEVGEAT